MYYHFKIRKEEVGFSAQCIELHGCVTEGDTKEELKNNMREALNLYLSEQPDSKIVHPLPNQSIKKSKAVVEVAPDLEVMFSLLLRHYRIEHKLSQIEMARRLNMNNIFSYQRLETKANPTLSMIDKLTRAFPDFPLYKMCR